MKILFAGSPGPARKTLEILYNKSSSYGFEIAGVLSNPPSAQGRHKTLVSTPVAQFAEENNLPVFTPEHLDGAVREQIEKLGADLLVCFAYGHIFGPKFLSVFPMGGINLHPTLLPEFRGCTPVPAAILNRKEKTAVTIQTLSLKMDEGNILAQKVVNLNGTETTGSLLEESAEIGAELILQLIKTASEQGKLPQGVPQSGEASYTGIITKEAARINWEEGAEIIEAKIRAYNPDPICWCEENGTTLRILQANIIEENAEICKNYKQKNPAAVPGTVLDFVKSDGIYILTGSGILIVKELQRQGKKTMNYKDFMNGARNFVGTVLK